MQSLLIILLTLLPIQSQSSVDTVLTEARLLLKQGKAQEALTKLAPLQAVTDARVKHLLGVAHYRTNNYIKAIEYLTPSLAALPNDSAEQKEATQLLGTSHYVLGHLAEAVPFLEQTIVWMPGSNELL
jgi:tetratricopeptide (TPR) repeat protein